MAANKLIPSDEVETPIAFVNEIKLVPYNSWVDADGAADRVQPGPIPDICRVLIAIINIGQNPLRLKSFCIEKRVVETLDPIPVYRAIQSIDETWQSWLVPANPIWFKAADDLTAINLTIDEKSDIEAGRRTLWIYGYFSYSDAFQVPLKHKFVARWDPNRGIILENRPEYT